MGFSIPLPSLPSLPNPIDVLESGAEKLKDAGGAVVNTTGSMIETGVDVAEAGYDFTENAAVKSFQFQTSVVRFGLEKSMQGAQFVGGKVVEGTENSIELGRRGISAIGDGFDRVTHPGDPNPPAAQGLEFSETKGASSLAYDAKPGESYNFPDGRQWEVVDVSASDGTFENGFRAIALQNGDDVIVAFAGTDPLSPGDIGTDILQAGGFAPPQYQQAADFAEKWANRAGAENVTVTGHSLGGALASYAAIENDLQATTVNAAPLALTNLGGNPLSSDVRNNANITNYYVPGEILTGVDIANPLDNRPGSSIAVQGASSTLNPLSTFKNHLLGNVAPDIEMPTLVK